MQVPVHWITFIPQKILSAYVDSWQVIESTGRYEPLLIATITNMLQSMVQVTTMPAAVPEFAPHSSSTATRQ